MTPLDTEGSQIRVWFPGLGTIAGRPTAWLVLTVRPGDVLGRVGLGWSPVYELLSGSSGGGFVLLHHTGRDAPAAADYDALCLRPGPGVAAALAA
jgi:hypothetical protein